MKGLMLAVSGVLTAWLGLALVFRDFNSEILFAMVLGIAVGYFVRNDQEKTDNRTAEKVFNNS